MAAFSIILLTDSAIPLVKPVDVLAEVDDSVGTATAQLNSSDDKSDNNDNGGTAAAESTRDNNNK